MLGIKTVQGIISPSKATYRTSNESDLCIFSILSKDSSNCQFSEAKIPIIKYSLPLSFKFPTLSPVTGLTYQEILGIYKKWFGLMRMITKQQTLIINAPFYEIIALLLLLTTVTDGIYLVLYMKLLKSIILFNPFNTKYLYHHEET